MSSVVAFVPPGPVTQDDIPRLEGKLDAALSALRTSTGIRADLHVLNSKQAMQFTNTRSHRSLARWVEKFAPFARTSNNRYSRAKLEIGRQRELAGIK